MKTKQICTSKLKKMTKWLALSAFLLVTPILLNVNVQANQVPSALPIPERGFGAYPRSTDIHINEMAVNPNNNTGAGGSNTTNTRHHVNNTAVQASPYNQGDYKGTIHIHRLNRSVRIFEGETMRNMDFGGGRFTFTGLESGDVGMIGHNRGSNGYFSFVRLLQEGDLITFYTNNGARQYRVTTSFIIHETNFEPLEFTGDNRLTLVTCVEYRQRYRRVAVAVRL